ncbi:MFS general substrate transporter [Cantharellus anzutake]|uniref:MFS general substrate transporter n=1 Tax=Cantharellus anzutake TaxID=1750568 RepID=UPI001904E9B3|nr:MFS general substrate transporter [Cantharellus anzutake]KAF8342000.1 MFS general substrate transporter [Cantharellus anzutake]
MSNLDSIPEDYQEKWGHPTPKRTPVVIRRYSSETGRTLSRTTSNARSVVSVALSRIATTMDEHIDEEDSNLVNWDGPNDPANPKNWNPRYKQFLTALTGLLTINVTLCSSAPAASVFSLSRRFGISLVASQLITSLFLLGFAIGPIIWGTTSEMYGRRIVFIISFSGFTLFIIGQALADNTATLFITRFLSGLFAAAPLSNGGGVVSDLWGPVERGKGVGIYATSVFVGSVLGPVIGGYLVQSGHQGWRWLFWCLFGFSFVCWVLCTAFLPETFAPVLLTRKARRLRKEDPVKNKDLYTAHEGADWSFRGIAQRAIIRPFVIMALEPILILLTLYSSLIYGILFGLFELFPIIWGERRGFDIGNTGLIFLGIGIGTTLGGFINVPLQRKFVHLAPLWQGFPPPEERLDAAIIGGPLLVIGIFWLGWTGEYSSIPWYVPALSTIPIGMAINLSFVSLLGYIIDTYLIYAASALGANAFFRAMTAFAFPLFTPQMVHHMGIQWSCTLLGCFSLLLAPIPWLFLKYGPQIRARSKWSPNPDLKIREALEGAGLLSMQSPRTSTASSKV